REARWEGRTNEDGIAEPRLVFDAPLEHGDDVEIEVWAAGDPAPLARGPARWAAAPPPPPDAIAATVRPSKRDGVVALDVAVEGERLVTGFPTPIWVRATAPGVAPEAIALDLLPE